MLVPPRVGEMAAYASLHQNSLGRSTTIERRPSRFRQSLQRLSRFVNRRHGHGRAVSCHGLGITIDTSYSSSTSDPPSDFEFGEVQSVTTSGSCETLNNDVQSGKLCDFGKKHGLHVVIPEMLPLSISGTKAKLVLSPNGIIELPKAVRKNIWRKAIVHDRKLFICSCYYCQTEGVIATQPSLTCTSRTVRAETIPIFYQENQFQHPLAHPANSSVCGWLNSIGADNRSLLRHLELTFLNTERAISSLEVHYQMRPAEQSVTVENVMWDDGQLGEMEWHAFTGLETETGSRVIEEDAQLIGTSLLFETDNEQDDTKGLDLDADNLEDEWETTSTSGESSGKLLAPTEPPQVHLTRKNGEAFGNPRWSFAGKFNDHLLRRLASLSHDPYERKPRKPVAVTLVPNFVVASDRAIDEDH